MSFWAFAFILLCVVLISGLNRAFFMTFRALFEGVMGVWLDDD